MKFSEKYLRELVAGKRERFRDRLFWALLRVLAGGYGFVLRARAAGYRLGVLPSYRMPVPVVSVGNITLGGTGKTPMVAWLARYFMDRGRKVAVLSRGYGGSAEGTARIVSDGKTLFLSAEEAGDEPVLLARKIPGLMVLIGSDRRQAAQLALAELKPDLFILDDGFQHLRLKRDLNVLLLDASNPFSNGNTLPAGFLREAPGAAKRADLVVYTRSRKAGLQPDLVPGKPLCRTSHRLAALVPLGGGEARGFDAIQPKDTVMAFSGIADPASFFDALEAEGVKLRTTLAFPDHTPYGEEELKALLRLKEASRSNVLLTTEKDAVKLLAVADKLGQCFAVTLDLEFEDATALEKSLARFV